MALNSLQKPGWLASGTLVIAFLFILPLVVIVSYLFSTSSGLWQHLFNTVLTDYIINSLLLMAGVSIGVLLIGISTAWLTSIYDFPGKRLFVWALLLPLAFPGYIIAYTYTGLLDASGPVQSALRHWTGWHYGDYWFFSIRSLGGAIALLSLVLYPYVYLLARSAFLEQSSSVIDAGRSLGYSRRQAWFKLGIPLARPAIVTGLTLALMETLADFGTVQYFGVSTFTTGIYRAFYGLGDTAAAAQLSTVLLCFVFALIMLERYSRKQVSYHDNKSRTPQVATLKGAKAWLASAICLFPVALGFLIPALVLLDWTFTDATIDDNFVSLAWNSFYLACIAAVIAVGLSLLLAYTKRSHKQRYITGAVALTGMGYALPGVIIAIGIIIPLAWMDHQLIDFFESALGWNVGLLLSGSLFALIFAYSVRFLAVSLGAIDSGLEKIKPNIDSAARLLGCRPLAVVKTIHLPLLRGSALTALLIVFVDVLKELPATLILRPFNFNTLAIKAYELAGDERLIDAAPASLLIVAVGLIPVILLSRSISHKRQTSRTNADRLPPLPSAEHKV